MDTTLKVVLANEWLVVNDKNIQVVYKSPNAHIARGHNPRNPIATKAYHISPHYGFVAGNHIIEIGESVTRIASTRGQGCN